MTQSLQPNKLFPERLPKDFHGPVKPFKRLRPIVQANEADDRQLQKQSLRLNAWKRRKSDMEVQQHNRQFISHPTRISEDNPQWLKTTYFYQQRALHHRKQKDPKEYNIFGSEKDEKRTDFRRTIFPVYEKPPFQFSWPENIRQNKQSSTTRNFFAAAEEGRNRIARSHYQSKKEVTPKIGSSGARDYSMRSTSIKIGHNRMLDTNSVF